MEKRPIHPLLLKLAQESAQHLTCALSANIAAVSLRLQHLSDLPAVCFHPTACSLTACCHYDIRLDFSDGTFCWIRNLYVRRGAMRDR